MNSSSEDKTMNGDSENVAVVKGQAEKGENCDANASMSYMGKHQEGSDDSACEKGDSKMNTHGQRGEHSGEGESKVVVMTEGEENGGEESSQQVVGSVNSPDDAGDVPCDKSECVVMEEVDETLVGQEDNNATKSPPTETVLDTKTSSHAEVDGSNTQDNLGKDADDPYAYVKREDFTSEKYKIEIRGLPRFYGYGELKKFLNDKLKLSSHKMKPIRNKNAGVFVCFKNEEDRQSALKTLSRLPWKGKMLTAMLAKPAPDPLVKKRKLENEARLNHPEKKPRLSDDEKLRNSTTPYWNLPYDEQLRKKYDYVMKIMCKLADQIMSVNPMLVPWIKRQKAKYKGMACNLLDIRKSPICEGYRNKCEFTIGIKQETKQRMVGFRLGSYVQGQVGVGAIDSLKHIPQRMKDTVKVFEKFIKESDWEPYNPETHGGHWRQLTLRLTTLNELMAIVLVNSKGTSDAEIDSAKRAVKAFFEDGEGKDLKVNSLYFQAFGRREAGKKPPKMEHLFGTKFITESILGLKFRISPEAFFQVNTPGAAVLYSTVSEMVKSNPSTTIVDVCCGTGTIGLSLAKDCGQVLGLEVVAPAIEDAKANAAENNITNVEFFTGKAEEILTSVLSRAKGEFVHAIVDPPRSGLQQKAIASLRGAEVIDKVIYVSCDPNAALKNFVDLARLTSKAYRGYPWVPVAAIPVDMFPHTAYCELVLLFQRINPINMPRTIPTDEDDYAVLSATLSESSQNPILPTLPENEGSATRGPETIDDSKHSESVSGKDQKESIVSSEQHAVDKQKHRRRRPGRCERIRARNFFEVVSGEEVDVPLSRREAKVSAVSNGSGPTAANKPAAIVAKPEPKSKVSILQNKGRLGPRVAFNRGQIGSKDYAVHNSKVHAELKTKGRDFNPRVGKKRRWRKDDEPPPRDGGYVHDEDLHHLSHLPRGSKESGARRSSRHSRSSPGTSHRDGIGRRSDGLCSVENVWLRGEQGAQDGREGRGRSSGSPVRKLLRGDGHRLEMKAHEAVWCDPIGRDYRGEWLLDVDSRSLDDDRMQNGKSFCDRKDEETRFGRVRSERSLMREADAAWEERKQRGSSSRIGRNEGGEWRAQGVESERWGRGGAVCDAKEEFNFRRKYNDEVERGRSNFSDLEERHDSSSGELFNGRSPEMLKGRSNDHFDIRFSEQFDHRPLEIFDRSGERFDRRSSERYDRRSPKRLNRSPCEKCSRRSSERVYRPQEHTFMHDSYQESRQKSVRSSDFIADKLPRDGETAAYKYPQQMENPLYLQKQYNELVTQPSINYRDNGNASKMDYLSFVQSSPRKNVGIIGSLELHRKNEVYVYRGQSDALPVPLDLDDRIPLPHLSAENRVDHYEKQSKSNMLHSSYDSGEPGVKKDHSVISRHVEVIRRPFMVDNKHGMLVDTSGKSLGTAEMLMVRAKNEMYEGSYGSQFSPNEGVPSMRLLEHREMSVLHNPWNADEPPIPTYRKSPDNKFNVHPEKHSERLVDGTPQANWTFDMGLKKVPERPWGEMGRSNQFRSGHAGMLNASMSKSASAGLDVDRRQTIPLQAKSHGAPSTHAYDIEKPISYSTLQVGNGPKSYCSKSNSQLSQNMVDCLDFCEIPEHSNASHNVPCNFESSANSRMPVLYNFNSLSARPAMLSQNPCTFMSSSVQGVQQVPSTPPKQSQPMQGHITDFNQQRMHSVPSSSYDSQNFKGRNPWSESPQQIRLQKRRW